MRTYFPRSEEFLTAFGAELLTVSTEERGKNIDLTEQRIEVVRSLVEQISDGVNLNQYSNSGNPEAHYRSTAEEIWKDVDGEINCVVVSVGTGGTVSGVGRRLKELSPSIVICGVEPYGSTMFGGVKGSYLQQGPGNYFTPPNLSLQYLDIKAKVTDRDAFLMTRRLAREEGVMVGGIVVDWFILRCSWQLTIQIGSD